MNCFWLLLGNAAVLLGSHEILRRMRTGAPGLDIVLFCLIRLLIISTLVLGAGHLSWLRADVLGGIAAAALAGMIWSGAHRRLPRPVKLESGWPLLLLAIAVTVKVLLQTWYFSPFVGDVLSYHLPKVGAWIVSGSVSPDVGADIRGWFPAGFELIETWWVVFLHHDVLIEMAGIEFLFLAVASIYSIARSLDWDHRTGLLAAALFGMTPGLQLQATSCLNDAPVAALVVALVALILGGGHPSLLAMTSLLGIGIKPTFLFLLPGPIVLYGLVRRDRRAGSPGKLLAIMLPLIALGVGSYWYIRNLLMFGIPSYPMGTDLGSHIQQVGPRLSSLSGNLANLLNERIYDDQRAPSAIHYRVSNWGPAAFALGIPALLVQARSDGRLRRLAGCFLVSMGVVFLMVFPDPWSMRFVLYMTALPALALAKGARDLRYLRPVVGAVLALQFLSTCMPDDLHSASLSRRIHQSWRDRSDLAGPLSVPAGEEVGYCADVSGPLYLLYGPDFRRGVTVLRERSVEDFLATLRRRSIEVFYVGGLGPPKQQVVDEGARRGLWAPFMDGFGSGYRLTERGRSP